MCPVTQSETSTTGQGRLRWGFKRHPRQGANVKSTWPGCEVKQVGDLSLLQYHSHSSHTHPWIVIADDRWFLCGGDPPPRAVRRNHFSRPWLQGWKGSQLQAIKPSQLDDFCSANNCLQEGQQGCGRTGRTARRNSERSKLSNSISNRSQGIVFHRRQLFQVALLPDPSGHTSGCLE